MFVDFLVTAAAAEVTVVAAVEPAVLACLAAILDSRSKPDWTACTYLRW